MSFVADLKVAFRSLTRAKGLALTVIVTLALGIAPTTSTARHQSQEEHECVQRGFSCIVRLSSSS
jgi:hypothetical protein